MHPRPKIKKLWVQLLPTGAKYFVRTEKKFVCINMWSIGSKFLTTLEYFVRTEKISCVLKCIAYRFKAFVRTKKQKSLCINGYCIGLTFSIGTGYFVRTEKIRVY
jgi:hypothetical protein